MPQGDHCCQRLQRGHAKTAKRSSKATKRSCKGYRVVKQTLSKEVSTSLVSATQRDYAKDILVKGSSKTHRGVKQSVGREEDINADLQNNGCRWDRVWAVRLSVQELT